jgi:5-hydroxyisourate hydrolase-like protein (transthyretin family)
MRAHTTLDDASRLLRAIAFMKPSISHLPDGQVADDSPRLFRHLKQTARGHLRRYQRAIITTSREGGDDEGIRYRGHGAAIACSTTKTVLLLVSPSRSRVIVNITVTVIDGVYGSPAEGVEVSLVSHPPEGEDHRVNGFTDSRGTFRYPVPAGALSGSWIVQLNVSAYFVSLGFIPSYEQVTAVVRMFKDHDNCRVMALVTPSAHESWYAR